MIEESSLKDMKNHYQYKRLDDMSSYAISLQQAIEYHCLGLVIPEYIAKQCPYHSKMLNKKLAGIE